MMHCLLPSVALASLAGDEARADIGEVGAHGLRGQHRGAVGDGAREQQAAVVELAHFGNQREGRQRVRRARRRRRRPGSGRRRPPAARAWRA